MNSFELYKTLLTFFQSFPFQMLLHKECIALEIIAKLILKTKLKKMLHRFYFKKACVGIHALILNLKMHNQV